MQFTNERRTKMASDQWKQIPRSFQWMPISNWLIKDRKKSHYQPRVTTGRWLVRNWCMPTTSYVQVPTSSSYWGGAVLEQCETKIEVNGQGWALGLSTGVRPSSRLHRSVSKGSLRVFHQKRRKVTVLTSKILRLQQYPSTGRPLRFQ